MTDVIRFEGRWIKPYAVPAPSGDLRDEGVYFILNYINEDLVLPRMETVVFIGRDLETGDVGQVYFQDIRSYHKGLRYDSGGPEMLIISMSERETGDVYEFEEALDHVLGCELRQRNLEGRVSIGLPGSENGGHEAADFETRDRLLPEVSDFSDFSDWTEYVEAHPELKDERARAQFIADMSPSRFEGRNLTLDPEPIRADELTEESIYFLIEYVDGERLIPVMDTVVFIGRNLEPGDDDKVYLEDIFSYDEVVSYDDPDDTYWTRVYIKSENDLKNVFKFQQAMEELMRCSIRRAKR